jgi:hypothetical protein
VEGADVNAQPFASAAPKQRSVHRPRTTAVDALALRIPVKDGFQPRIALHHALVIVIGMMSRGLDGHEVTRSHLDQWLEVLAEIAPMNRLVVCWHMVVIERTAPDVRRLSEG